MKNCNSCLAEVEGTFNFCPSCGYDLGKPIVCKNCNYSNEFNSKFCQECGDALFAKYSKSANKIQEDRFDISTIPSPSKSGITIEFPYSTAQSFDFAINEAKKFDTFEKFGSDKKAIYRVSLHQDELYKAKELLEQLKGWRKRTVYDKGEKAAWDSIFSFSWCYEKKLSSFKPNYYCFGYENDWDFNIWGCIRTNMPFNEHSKWFTYGKWLNSDGDWEFDKDRIKHELLKNLHPYRYCPALTPALIEEVIDALPQVINPKRNKNWKFVESYSAENNSLVWKTTKYGYEEIKYITGVCPNGKAFLKDITDSLKRKLPDFIKA